MSRAARPLDGNGVPDGKVTALEVALDATAPLLRHPHYPDQRRRDGRFAKGNTASVKHGQRARLTLAKRKQLRMAELTAKAEAQGGKVDWQLEPLLRRVAECEVHAERASDYVNQLTSQGEPPTSADVQAALAIHLGNVDRIARAMALVNDMRPVPKTAASAAPFTIMVIDELTDDDVERLRAERDEHHATEVQRVESPDPSVLPGDEERAALPTGNIPTNALPVRLNATVRQWTGSVGSVQPDNGGALLLIRREDIGGLHLEIGSRVSVATDGRKATACMAAQEED